MRPFPLAPLVAVLALAGCDRGPVALDIVSLEPARSAMPMGPAPGAEQVALNVTVRAGQLRTLLDRRGAFDLAIVDCAAPDAPGEKAEVTFGGTPVSDLSGSQLSDDPDMLVLLNALVSRQAVSLAQPCGRFVGRPGMMAPEVTSPPVPLARH